MMPTPRPYQRRAIAATYASLRSGKRCPIVVASTPSGAPLAPLRNLPGTGPSQSGRYFSSLPYGPVATQARCRHPRKRFVAGRPGVFGGSGGQTGDTGGVIAVSAPLPPGRGEPSRR
jgi:hypothetical protein